MPPKAKNYLLILLSAATVTTGVIAWQQTARLATLQDQLSKAKTATATVKPHRSAPKAEALPTVAEAPGNATAETSAPTDATAGQTAASARGKRPDFASLMANPEFAQAINLHQRAALDGRYADLFKKLQLPPAELEKLKTLLVERQATRMDVMTSARAQGLDPRANRDELNKLTAAAQAEVDAAIKTSLGETVFNQYQNYETTQPQRNLVGQLDQRLSYTSTPLNANQTTFLVNALATPTHPAGSETTDPQQGGTGNWGGNRAPSLISDAVIQQAQSVLTPDQLSALKQLQAEQKAQQQMRDLMRSPPKTPATR